jgi:hypothetical protein
MIWVRYQKSSLRAKLKPLRAEILYLNNNNNNNNNNLETQIAAVI